GVAVPESGGGAPFGIGGKPIKVSGIFFRKPFAEIPRFGPTHADDGMVVVLWKGRTVPAALLFEIPAALTPGILSQQIRAARLPIAGLVNVSAKVGEAGFGAAEVDSIHPRHGEELH